MASTSVTAARWTCYKSHLFHHIRNEVTVKLVCGERYTPLAKLLAVLFIICVFEKLANDCFLFVLFMHNYTQV